MIHTTFLFNCYSVTKLLFPFYISGEVSWAGNPFIYYLSLSFSLPLFCSTSSKTDGINYLFLKLFHLTSKWSLRDVPTSHPLFHYCSPFKKYLLTLERERKEREKMSICCSTYSCIHLLTLVCNLTGYQTCNLGASGWCSNELNYPARAIIVLLLRKQHLLLIMVWNAVVHFTSFFFSGV